MGNTSFGWLGGDSHHLSFSMLVILSFAISLNIKPISAGVESLKINRSLFYDLTDPCTRSGEFQTVVNGSQPASLLKLDNTRSRLSL